nr:MAG TPA: hypothetical protein [Caudoviricetes sp.]
MSCIRPQYPQALSIPVTSVFSTIIVCFLRE